MSAFQAEDGVSITPTCSTARIGPALIIDGLAIEHYGND